MYVYTNDSTLLGTALFIQPQPDMIVTVAKSYEVKYSKVIKNHHTLELNRSSHISMYICNKCDKFCLLYS